MSRKRRRKKTKDLGQEAKNSEKIISSSHLFSVNLIPRESQTFLGFPIKNINQLWDWKTLKDIDVNSWK